MIDSRHRIPQAVTVEAVALNNLDILTFQPAEPGGRPDQAPDPGPCRQQGLHQMAADEPGSTRDQSYPLQATRLARTQQSFQLRTQ